MVKYSPKTDLDQEFGYQQLIFQGLEDSPGQHWTVFEPNWRWWNEPWLVRPCSVVPESILVSPACTQPACTQLLWP